MKIIVTESIALEGIEHLKQKGYEVDVKFGISREDLLEIIQEYDALIVRSVTKVNEELLEKATALKVVGRAGNGVDNIDLKGRYCARDYCCKYAGKQYHGGCGACRSRRLCDFPKSDPGRRGRQAWRFPPREIYRQRAGWQNGPASLGSAESALSWRGS